MSSDSVDILIVGCGPAGTSTALHLCQRDPGWSKRILMIDRACHPRDKLCGGILSFLALDILQHLDLPLGTPSVPIDNAIVKCLGTGILFSGNAVFQVIRRSEFDAWLLDECEDRGVAVGQGEEVLDMETRDTDVLVTTSKRSIRARIVVAADGTTGITRRLLFPNDRARLCRLLETLTPVNPESSWEFRHRALYSDWSPMARGIQGYYWDIPSYVGGVPMMNRGMFDSRVNHRRRPEMSMKSEMERFLSVRGLDMADFKLKGFPIRPLNRRTQLSTNRVVFVGDAAGADPLAGEGISFALGYGRPAAAAISDAFTRGDFSFADYRQRLHDDPLFRHLRNRVRLARFTNLSKNPQILQWALKLAGQIFVRAIDRRSLHCAPPQVRFFTRLSGDGKKQIETFLNARTEMQRQLYE